MRLVIAVAPRAEAGGGLGRRPVREHAGRGDSVGAGGHLTPPGAAHGPGEPVVVLALEEGAVEPVELGGDPA